MIEAIFQGLLITILVFLTLAVVFVVWVSWTKRAELKALWHKSWNNAYSKDELFAKIYFAEASNKPKNAIYWRSRLYELYPEEHPRGRQ